MSQIDKTLHMSFNDSFVGHVHIWSDGEITAEFSEDEDGASCIAFLVAYALRTMLTKTTGVDEFSVNLN